jgi:hypothetical protein
MGEISQRQLRVAARRAARDGQSKRREAARARAKRLEDLAVTVMVAVAEREKVIEQADRRAGEAMREMTEVEGLSLREAVEWCGEAIDVREATRLRRLGRSHHEQSVAAERSRETVTATAMRLGE